MPFTIIRQDITKLQVDAIVNAANTNLLMGGGVCGAIFKAAGAAKLQAACQYAAPIHTGGAAITPGFELPAKYIIHAAGPIYAHRSEEENEKLLYSSYTEALNLALQHNCTSIAFPLISSGIYGYPKAEALKVATAAIKAFLSEHDMDVYLAIIDKESFMVSEKLLSEVESYIDENYIGIRYVSQSKINVLEEPKRYFCVREPKGPLVDLLCNLDEPFSTTLLKLIEARGKTNAEVYRRANIDRRHFSKIISNKDYVPSKRTVIALAIALELTIDEVGILLSNAGYSLSHSQKFDVIVEYFIEHRKYDIFEINEVLFEYDQPLLGGK